VQNPCPGGGMADTTVLEAVAVRCAGSSPVPGTMLRRRVAKAKHALRRSRGRSRARAPVVRGFARQGLRYSPEVSVHEPNGHLELMGTKKPRGALGPPGSKVLIYLLDRKPDQATLRRRLIRPSVARAAPRRAIVEPESGTVSSASPLELPRWLCVIVIFCVSE
jgi:hypothetical protein